ncbi:MAG: SurA N-terminal domain-containing protein [Cyclobacteriaceae bacterium]|nr:SurA N-terminal domain-containing protein [Cyclobacteriaceae bacterium]
MALISILREKMTKWVVGAIALSMGAFIVGSDLFGSGPNSIFGGQDKEVGEIAGTSISLEDYQIAIQERKNSYILNFGRQPGERENPTLESQAWEMLISRNAIQPEYEKVGIRVTTDEVWDMLQGKNVDENIKSSFTDSTGRFDRGRLISYLKSVEAMPVTSEQRIRWDIFRSDLQPSRERLKYENLLTKTTYVTAAEAERDYHNQNDVAEVKFLYVPYFAASDSLVTVTDSELKAYYEKNKKKYKVETTRSMSYVAFDVNPSTEDTLAIREEITRMSNDIKTITEDSLYALSNSDAATPFGKYTIASLPPTLLNQRASLTQGQVIGPLLEDGKYRVYKISKIGKDTVYTFRASHILIKWDTDTPEGKKAAKEKAQKILKDIKAGASFADKAREFGTDGSASSGGDLGWFVSGQMVKEFEKPVSDARKTGVLNDVVETDFGYHLIDVTNLKDNTYYNVVILEREIAPSDETLNTVLRKADAFATDLSGVEEFKEKAKKEGLSVFDANDVGTAERRINNLGEARQMVTWLFREATVGKVSTVFDLTDTYVVAVMTGETEKGFKSFDKVKDEITPLVRNEAKGKYIQEKLKGKTEPLEELAKLFPRDAVVNSMSDLKLNTNSMPTVGYDPVVIGAVFSLENGKRSLPLAGENGVVVLDLQAKTEAPAIGDFTMFKNQLLQSLSTRGGYYITEALKEAAKVEDKRYKFY